ncbi:MAG: hypothetical protein DRO88_07965 [Promethearchaeia archaeon]|nr:MAG: hypothetical protein DRO88_07965 [Candidatus Lokiarchaeia archaeon]
MLTIQIRKNKKEEVFKKILERIVELEFKPGQILNEKGLAEEFGVSRPVVREVFYRLENLGFITFIHKIGIQVKEIDFRAIGEIMEIRIEIEKLLGKFVLKKITPQELQELKAIMEKIHQLNVEENYSEFIALDKEFHTKIRNVCKNELLRSTSEKYYLHVNRMWAHTQARVTDVGNIIKSMDDMVTALENKDEKAMTNAIIQHSNSFLKQIRNYFTIE